jgi:hypothetical protein
VLLSLPCTACGGSELPPRIPSTDVHERVASRVELVDLVISDRERAEKVRALYVQIEALMLDAKKSEAKLLDGLGAGPARTDAEIRATFKTFSDAEVGALERYAELELALRTLTTPDEFKRLDAIK